MKRFMRKDGYTLVVEGIFHENAVTQEKTEPRPDTVTGPCVNRRCQPVGKRHTFRIYPGTRFRIPVQVAVLQHVSKSRFYVQEEIAEIFPVTEFCSEKAGAVYLCVVIAADMQGLEQFGTCTATVIELRPDLYPGMRLCEKRHKTQAYRFGKETDLYRIDLPGETVFTYLGICAWNKKGAEEERSDCFHA